MNSITCELARSFIGDSGPEKSNAVGDIDELLGVKQKIAAVEYCLDNSGNVFVPENADANFCRLIRRYESDDRACLLKLLESFQGKETALLQRKASAENEGKWRTKHQLTPGYYNEFSTPPWHLITTAPPFTRMTRFSTVWTAIVNDQLIMNPGNSRLWSLRDGDNIGIKWIGDVDVLYNRPCYEVVTMDIENASLSQVLVIGTPGIGKTLYLQAFLVHLARRARVEGRALPTIHYMYFDDGAKLVTLSLLANGSVVDISNVADRPEPDYLLSDSVDLVTASSRILCLEVASDKKANYKCFAKRVKKASSKGKTIVMPLFSLDELMCIMPLGMDVATAEFRFQIYGGSARNFMGEQLEDVDVLPVVDETLMALFSGIKASHSQAWHMVATEISAQLLSGKDSKEVPQTVNSMMWHMLERRSKTWASTFMEWLAAAIIDERTADVVDELEQIIGKSGIGNLFEALSHRKLTKSAVSFLLKPLLASLPPAKPEFEVAEFNLPIVRFKTIEEIGNLPDGSYGLPMNSNFPVIDSVVQPLTLIQFTVSPQKHEGSLKMLPAIRAQLREKDPSKHRLIFVIPLENVKTFRYHANLPEIRQLICVTDPSAVGESSLMNENEKKAWIG